MPKAFINVESIRQKLLKNPEVQAKAYLEVKKLTDAAHEDLMDEFNKHPVTVEIEEGSKGNNVGNISGTLNGYDGSLFGFIGFNAGENPIEPVRQVLKNVSLENRPQINRKSLTFKYNFPTLKEVEEAGPSPSRYDTGSWVAKISRGISGFASFMARLGSGVSDMGLQAKNKKTGEPIELRKGNYKKVPYMSQMLINFKYRLFNKAGRI